MKFKVKAKTHFNVCALFVCDELEYYHYIMLEEEKNKLVDYYNKNPPKVFNWYKECGNIFDEKKTLKQLKYMKINLWTAKDIIDSYK